MKNISVLLLLLALTNAVMAQKINIVPTSTLKGPQGQVANAVIELSRSAGFDITPIQKGGCGEAVDYFENTKDPVAIVWSDTMIKNTKVTKQNCIINFDNASAIAVTYAPYDLCVLKGNTLEPNKTYKLGNNKFNPAATIRQELNKNKMGINFFTKTGLQCANGADMWTYFQGIPKGDALGATIQRAMNEMGFPALRGLAPGMIEDTKSALDPMPILQATFGNVYPDCELKTLPVGDDRGLIKDPISGDEWAKGDVQYVQGRPQQTRWIQKQDRSRNPVYMSQADWLATPKTMNADGSPKQSSGFADYGRNSLFVAIMLGCLAVAIVGSRK